MSDRQAEIRQAFDAVGQAMGQYAETVGAKMGAMVATAGRTVAVQRQVAVEEAWMRLIAVTPGSIRTAAMSEVARREEVFAEIRRTTERGGFDPLVSAIDSVRADIVFARM